MVDGDAEKMKKKKKTVLYEIGWREKVVSSLDQIVIVSPPLLILKRIRCLSFPLTKVSGESVLVQIREDLPEKPPKK